MTPKHLMICISGFSGTGKDEFAKRLVEHHGAIQTGLADPAKRHMADVYGFTYDQLFGPSSMRNSGDIRHPKTIQRTIGLKLWEGPLPTLSDGLVGNLDPEKSWWVFSSQVLRNQDATSGGYDDRGAGRASLSEGRPYVPGKLGKATIFVPECDPAFWLSPRESLQKYCELMNDLVLETWIKYGIDMHKKLREVQMHADEWQPAHSYNRMEGLEPYISYAYPTRKSVNKPIVTCFSDFRHWHEIHEARKATDDQTRAILVRIKRPGIDKPPFNHRSETEQATIPDGEFDEVVVNSSTIESLHLTADKIVEKYS